jgi:CBS domain-containing protein
MGLCGIFGEREFIAAAFPRYLGELSYAAFVSRSADEALERRGSCRTEPVSQHMNTEHVDVGPDYADAQVAETFLHHRVLILPVVDGGRVLGVITRADFFRQARSVRARALNSLDRPSPSRCWA